MSTQIRILIKLRAHQSLLYLQPNSWLLITMKIKALLTIAGTCLPRVKMIVAPTICLSSQAESTLTIWPCPLMLPIQATTWASMMFTICLDIFRPNEQGISSLTSRWVLILKIGPSLSAEAPLQALGNTLSIGSERINELGMTWDYPSLESWTLTCLVSLWLAQIPVVPSLRKAISVRIKRFALIGFNLLLFIHLLDKT